MPGRKPRLLILVVAYFAEQTINKVLRRIPASLGDDYDVETLVIDDGSGDRTFDRAVAVQASNSPSYRLTVLHNPVNQGYGGNQKIGYHYAIEKGFDYVALLHGDGQYAPELLPILLKPLHDGEADAVLGSRMIEPKNALAGGMPFYKFIGNRVLTAIQNYLLKTKLSEFHSGYRIYAVSALKDLPFERNSNGFHFDTEIIIQLVIARKRIREIAIPTYYGDEISRVNGLNYAKSVVKACLQARLQRIHLFYDRRFDCSPPSQEQRVYPSLDFDRDASRVLNLIPPGSRVLNLGSAMTSLCVALREQKGCVVVSRDPVETALARPQNDLIHSDLALGIADHDNQKFDYILALDLIGKLRAPEEFLDLLRAAAARNGARVILTAANVGFLPMRLSLLVGRFEYSKRGILDLRHTRLFTLKTLRRAMRAAGFDIERIEGVVVPFHLVFGSSFLAGASLAINRALARLWPALFGFELLCIGKAHPTLETLLRAAETTATQKMPAVLLRMSRSRKFD